MISFYESFDEIFSLPSTKKILVDDAYLYNALHYKMTEEGIERALKALKD